jgi:hypothetical protein
MRCSSKIGRSIGFIFVLSVAVAMMIGFSTKVAKADPFIVPTFDPNNFPGSPDINNPFFTLIPGTAFCYESDSDDGETNEVTVVTDGDGDPCTITIAGVAAIVVRDAVFVDGDPTEDTYDFYAQDNGGHVWYLGEATNECLEEAPDNTFGTWNANAFNAVTNPNGGGMPGIVMLDDPMPGNTYQQEFLEGVAEDMAQVKKLNADVTDNCDKDCLKTKEWAPLAPGDVEHKFYSDHLGIRNNVRTEGLKGGQTVLTDLVDVVTGLADTGDCPTVFSDAEDFLCNEDHLPPMNCEFE